MNILSKVVFGSRLYGLETPESDWDFKGVFLPSVKDCLLWKTSSTWSEKTGDDQSKNTSEDIETQLFALQHFIKLACKGEMVVLDLVHADGDKIIKTSPAWDLIRENRSKFYSKNFAGYMGYIKSQSLRYSERGNRLQSCEEVVRFLKSQPEDIRLSEIWDQLPDIEHTRKYIEPDNRQADQRMYEVVGRKMGATLRCGYALEIVDTFLAKYGERAKAAKENKGVDWKAICHAFRICYQLIELCQTGDLRFPLKERDFLLKIKTGQLDFEGDGLPQKLEELIDQAEELLGKSNFPNKVDVGFWDGLVLEIYRKSENGYETGPNSSKNN